MTRMDRRLFLLGLGVGLLPGWASADAATRLALGGYDPVAYFTLGKPTLGQPAFETVFDGTRYRFASAEHRDRFVADPDRYAPQFAGACTGGVSAGMKIEANPENFLIVEGRLFVFASAPGDPRPNVAAVLAQARQNWPALKDKPFE